MVQDVCRHAVHRNEAVVGPEPGLLRRPSGVRPGDYNAVGVREHHVAVEVVERLEVQAEPGPVRVAELPQARQHLDDGRRRYRERLPAYKRAARVEPHHAPARVHERTA